jgi:hypothetical protein
MNKRTIFEQADDLVSQVDVLVETYIAANQDHHNRIESVNAMREKWIKVIRECEAFNILHCQEDEAGKEPLQKSDIFKKFCLLFENKGDVLVSGRFTWRLLVIPDTYLSPGQIMCFQELMRIIKNSQNVDQNLSTAPVWRQRSSFDRLFESCSLNTNPDVRK